MAMASTIFVVLMISEDVNLVIFMESVALHMDVLWVGRVMAAELDEISAVEVAVLAIDVLKIFDVIVSEGGSVVLEYNMVA